MERKRCTIVSIVALSDIVIGQYVLYRRRKLFYVVIAVNALLLASKAWTIAVLAIKNINKK